VERGEHSSTDRPLVSWSSVRRGRRRGRDRSYRGAGKRGYDQRVTDTRVSEFTLHRRVNFYEVDQAGIVHFSNYFRYMEEAEYGFWRSAGVSLEPTPDYGFPRVAASFDYHAPLRFDDAVAVRLQIAHIGRTSLRYACHITRGDTRIATGTMTLVCVSPRDMRPVAFPADRFARIAVGA